jgi:hypothetical protein
MSQYFLSSKPLSTGKYVLHRIGCPVLRPGEPGIFLGTYDDAGRAIKAGQRYFRKTVVCPFCLKKHHKKKGPCANAADYSGMQVKLTDLAPSWYSIMLCGVN